MGQTIWKGYLAFGLLTIPVRLAAAARRDSISFHMLHRNCGGRLEQRLACKTCGAQVSREDTVKGYEEASDRYLMIDGPEIDGIAPASSTTMEIFEFVAAPEVDPICFDASYYLEPEKAGRAAFRLLVEAMRRRNRVAVAKLAMHHREHAVLIRPYGPGLALHTLYYEPEVRAYDLNLTDVEVSAEHLEIAGQLLETMVRPFDPGRLRDEYQVRLLELIDSKRKGQTLEVGAAPAPRPVVDILDALVKSLERKPPATAEAAKTAPAPKTRKRVKSA